MAPTVKQIQAAKSKKKLYRISDSNGLCLEVTPSGSKLWRYRYRFNGKEKMMAIGSFPATSLKEARDKRDEQRTILERGINPSEYKKDQQAAVFVNTRVTPSEKEIQGCRDLQCELEQVLSELEKLAQL